MRLNSRNHIKHSLEEFERKEHVQHVEVSLDTMHMFEIKVRILSKDGFVEPINIYLDYKEPPFYTSLIHSPMSFDPYTPIGPIRRVFIPIRKKEVQ